MRDIINKLGKFYINDSDIDFKGKIKSNGKIFYLESENLMQKIKIKSCDLIFGEIGGTFITLYKCHLYNKTYKLIFIIEYIFKDFKNENLTFNVVDVKFNNLEEWMEIPVVEQKTDEKITINFPSKLKSYELNKFTLRLFCNKKIHGSLNRYEITNDFKIRLEYPKKITFDELLNDINLIKNFLSLCMYNQTEIQKLTLISEDKTGNEQEINVYSKFFKQTNIPLNFHSILLHYSELEEEFVKIFNRWFEIYDIFENTIYLYFMTISYKTNAETLFLTYTQSLEAFIRKNNNFNKFYMDKSDYENIKQEFGEFLDKLNLNDSSHEQSLKNRIKYGNEYSFRKRLNVLINYLNEYEVINNLNDEYNGNFVKTIVDTRNYYTHYGDEFTFTKSGRDLLFLAYDLKLIIELCILHELKLPKELINKKLSNKLYNYRR